MLNRIKLSSEQIDVIDSTKEILSEEGVLILNRAVLTIANDEKEEDPVSYLGSFLRVMINLFTRNEVNGHKQEAINMVAKAYGEPEEKWMSFIESAIAFGWTKALKPSPIKNGPGNLIGLSREGTDIGEFT